MAGAEPKEDSPQDLAARLREALASNTIGGRAGEESKWRGMAEDVRQAQSSFARLVPVPGEAGRQLAERHVPADAEHRYFRRNGPAADERSRYRQSHAAQEYRAAVATEQLNPEFSGFLTD